MHIVHTSFSSRSQQYSPLPEQYGAGGGGGGGGGGGSHVIAFQVGIVDGRDFQAEGTTTEKPAVLEVEPGTTLVGPRFEIKTR